MVKKVIAIFVLLCAAVLVAMADGVSHLAFSETFDVNGGSGGRDDSFSGNIASREIIYDNDGWSGNKSNNNVYGGFHCLRFGDSSTNGNCTTPEIVLVGTAKTATLTFNAAGWGDSNKNKLTVTANEGVTLSGDNEITLVNGVWTLYTVNIAVTTAERVQLTFKGKRGFLDDVKVVETVTAINNPLLTDEFLFWPNTTETATRSVTLVPSDSTTVYYTTDGTEPSTENGKVATLTSQVIISGTTTVKAKAYYKTVASEVVNRTYTVGETVTGVAAFRALADGTEARLYLADDANARVLHGYNNQEMYLRDATGTLCFDFGTTATFNPAPQHNQHVAGWIVGQKQTVNGLPKLVATANTSTDYLALAAPVTEADTEPTAVDDIANVNQYLGDWVTVQNVRKGTDLLTVSNTFGAEHFTEVYNGALVDVSGIVTADSQLSPVYYNGIWPVVYVIDEDENFYLPNVNIEHATIRLKRTLSKDYWNTFAVPFDIPSFDGYIRAYNNVVDNTMYFSEASDVEAGKPYLVKPSADIENPVFTDVTLSAMPLQDIEESGYAFVGIYSPTELATDKTVMFMKSDGRLYYPSTGGNRMKGMRAYFKIPKDQEVRLFVEGDMAGISPLQDAPFMMQKNAGVYDLQGRRVNIGSKGIYIVNGKKIVIH